MVGYHFKSEKQLSALGRHPVYWNFPFLQTVNKIIVMPVSPAELSMKQNMVIELFLKYKQENTLYRSVTSAAIKHSLIIQTASTLSTRCQTLARMHKCNLGGE